MEILSMGVGFGLGLSLIVLAIGHGIKLIQSLINISL